MKTLFLVLSVLNAVACNLTLTVFLLFYRKPAKKETPEGDFIEKQQFKEHWIIMLFWLLGTIVDGAFGINVLWVVLFVVVGAYIASSSRASAAAFRLARSLAENSTAPAERQPAKINSHSQNGRAHLNDDEKLAIADRLATLLAIQMTLTVLPESVEVSEVEIERGRINGKALGYVYGFVDAALQSMGLDIADVPVGIPILYHVLRRLFPGSRFATRNHWSKCSCVWACRPIRLRTRNATPDTFSILFLAEE